MKIDEETKTSKINCKLLADNAAEDSAAIEDLSIIYGFVILFQGTMKLVDHLYYQQWMKLTIVLMALMMQ